MYNYERGDPKVSNQPGKSRRKFERTLKRFRQNGSKFKFVLTFFFVYRDMVYYGIHFILRLGLGTREPQRQILRCPESGTLYYPLKRLVRWLPVCDARGILGI